MVMAPFCQPLAGRLFYRRCWAELRKCVEKPHTVEPFLKAARIYSRTSMLSARYSQLNWQGYCCQQRQALVAQVG